MVVRGGRGGYVLQGGESPPGRHLQAPESPTERSEVSTSPGSRPRTWLSDYIDAYHAGFGEAPSPVAIKRLARTFKALEVHLPQGDLVARFQRYCRETPLRFYSVEHFANTLPAWKDGAEDREAWKRDPTAPRPGESTDAYITRIAR